MGFPDTVNPTHPTRLDRMRIAFAVKVAREIVDADGVLDMGEIELLTRAFPTPLMQRVGFLDTRTRLTPEVEAVFADALRELPRVLTLTEKLELVTLFHRTCLADGELHPSELDILMRAARQLVIPERALDDHLHHLRGGGTIVPPVRSRGPNR